MLANLAGFVEELVVKTAEMQGVEVDAGGGGEGGDVRSMTNMEDMQKWLNYAKGVVDQSLDNYHAGVGGAPELTRGSAAAGRTGSRGGGGSRAGRPGSGMGVTGNAVRPKSGARQGARR